MRSVYTAFFLLLLPVLAVGQSQYYDAIELHKLLKSNGGSKFPNPGPVDDCKNNPEKSGCKTASILRKYAATENADYKIIATEYLSNPFLKDFIVVPSTSSIDGTARALSRTVNAVGGLDVTNFADGLARFLVKRMKEELNILFFEAFERELAKQKDLQALFPSTHNTLLLAGKELYNYQRFLPALRQAFEYDLDEFLTNSYAWSVSAATDMNLLAQLQKDPATHNAIKVILYVARELDRGQHPGEILHTITGENLIQFDKVFKGFTAYLQIADFISQSLHSNHNASYWINRQEASAFRDPTFVKIYLGLMYQSCPEIVLPSGKKFKDEFALLANRLTEAEEKVKQLADDVASVEDALKRITDNSEHVKGSDYFITAQAILKLTDRVVTLLNADATPLKELSFYADHGGFLFTHIESRAYSAAVFEAYTIFDHALTGADSKKQASAVMAQFLKYGTFMATVAEAESSAEVADAIEAIALPAGSARIKREMAWNISLNAYLGAFYGSETITVDGEDETERVAGVFAPVGLAISRNFRICKTNWSLTAFGTIIDVGALASYRLGDNDQVERVPDITLKNIFAPGAYLVLGFPRIPISIGYGYQLTPQLRNVTSNAIQLNDHANRLSGFIAVDIPLVNFWSRSRKE